MGIAKRMEIKANNRLEEPKTEIDTTNWGKLKRAYERKLGRTLSIHTKYKTRNKVVWIKYI